MAIFKIIGGSTMGNDSLCDSCDFGHVVQGHGVNQKITWCKAEGFGFGNRINFPVANCSEYWPRGAFKLDRFGPTKDWAERSALCVDANNAGKSKRAGFDRE